MNTIKKEVLQLNDVQFSLKSMVDDFGRVFFHNKKVYRAINNNCKEYCLMLLKSELFKELHSKKLIPSTTIAEFSLPDYELILEHERLPEILQHEWTFSMLKDAAVSVGEINRICNKYGYELKDAHTLNVLFRGTQPVYIDIGSVWPKKVSEYGWIAYEEYLGAFIIPLLFWSEGKFYLARKLLESNFYRMSTIPAQSVREAGHLELLNILNQPYKFKFRSKILFSSKQKSTLLSFISESSRSIVKAITKRNTQSFTYSRDYDSSKNLSDIFPLKTIHRFIQQVSKPLKTSMWEGYHTRFYSEDGSITYSNRFLLILNHIKRLDNVKTVIDLAGNEGYFSHLLSKELKLERIILADYDENAIDAAYNNFKFLEIKSIYTILLNFMFTPDLAGTANRLQSDLVIALAVTHHLILTSNFSLPAIFERLRLYSKKYVAVEFMPLGLWATGQSDYPHLPDWYTREWFKNCFQIYFKLLVEEQVEKNRVLFLGEICIDSF